MIKGVHFHRRNLPHIYRVNSTYFVTFRIKGSIPLSKLVALRNWKEDKNQIENKDEKYKREIELFGKYDGLLHESKENNYLIKIELARLIEKQICRLDEELYNLICYCIMPNHVHIVFSLYNEYYDIGKIMQRLKRVTAFQINKNLGRKGSFWQAESYDHIVRNEEELNRIIDYVRLNPVKANLVDSWEDWKFTYCKYS